MKKSHHSDCNACLKNIDFPQDWMVVRLLAILKANLPEISARYHVKSLGLFGSYVRNAQKKGSDLDVLVEFGSIPSMFKFLELEEHLSRLLGIKVDLVMRDVLKPAIGQYILAEVVPV
jgi:predicted nucleotidyltransferase